MKYIMGNFSPKNGRYNYHIVDETILQGEFATTLCGKQFRKDSIIGETNNLEKIHCEKCKKASQKDL